MLSYFLEDYSGVIESVKPYLVEHWKEFGDYQDKFKLDVNFELYEKMANNGTLVCMAGRNREFELKAYAWIFVTHHLHHKTVLCANVDTYYIDKEHRGGLEGVRFFKAMESLLKSKGVVKLFAGTHPSKDASAIFQRLEWNTGEYGFTKLIGE